MYNIEGPMQLTAKENAVVEHLQRTRVARMNELVQALDLSRMTVVRALKKYGSYTSFNHNASYYTLQDIPRFDDRGLWFHEHIGFSQHGNLKQTLLALIEQSEAGFTVAELERTLATRVGVLLSRLRGEQQLGLFYRGRQAVYLARDPRKQSRQRTARGEAQESPAPVVAAEHRRGVPAGRKALEVIALLVQLIRTPQASDASLARTLQNADVPLTAEQVRQVGQPLRHALRTTAVVPVLSGASASPGRARREGLLPSARPDLLAARWDRGTG